MTCFPGMREQAQEPVKNQAEPVMTCFLGCLLSQAGCRRERAGRKRSSIHSSGRGQSEDVDEEMQHLLDDSTTSSGADEVPSQP